MILRHDQLKIEVDADGDVRLDCTGPVTEDGLLWLVAIGGPAALGHVRRAHGALKPAGLLNTTATTHTDVPVALDG
jgi:hypothetical protein